VSHSCNGIIGLGICCGTCTLVLAKRLGQLQDLLLTLSDVSESCTVMLATCRDYLGGNCRMRYGGGKADKGQAYEGIVDLLIPRRLWKAKEIGETATTVMELDCRLCASHEAVSRCIGTCGGSLTVSRRCHQGRNPRRLILSRLDAYTSTLHHPHAYCQGRGCYIEHTSVPLVGCYKCRRLASTLSHLLIPPHSQEG